jgi:hypothetical protein
MATTTNYGWDTPDDTDLVKDGAAAIRTLGSSVDTTTKALNPSTTEGDIEYRSATANTNTRLGIGTAGQVLQVNSGATAPEWATFASGGMTLISTTSLTGASTTISSIPATYNNLQLVIQNFRPATDAVDLDLRLNGDSGSNYRPLTFNLAPSSGAFTSTEIQLSGDVDNGTQESLSVIDLFDYKNTTTKKFFRATSVANDATTPTNINARSTHGFYNSTAAISSITLLFNSGNITSGTALLYGVK